MYIAYIQLFQTKPQDIATTFFNAEIIFLQNSGFFNTENCRVGGFGLQSDVIDVEVRSRVSCLSMFKFLTTIRNRHFHDMSYACLFELKLCAFVSDAVGQRRLLAFLCPVIFF